MSRCDLLNNEKTKSEVGSTFQDFGAFTTPQRCEQLGNFRGIDGFACVVHL